MIEKTRSRYELARQGLSAAIACTSLLLAACSGDPATGARQATADPTTTLAALGHAPAIRDLTGLAPGQVAALIGNPDLRRVDPPAEIWQYRTADCVLDLYFYDSGSSSRLVYAESHSRQPQQGPSQAASCRNDLAPLVHPTRQTRL